MFQPIEIRGDERTDFYGRLSWDEEEQAIALEFFSEKTGEPDPDGDAMLFGLAEAEDLGWALIHAVEQVDDANRAAAVAAARAERAKARAEVAAQVAADAQRNAALRPPGRAYGRD